MDVLGLADSGKDSGRTGNPNLLFEYALKFLLISAFLELVLYRLVSRLGMHMAKAAEKSEYESAIRLTFETLSYLGLILLNVTSILLFLVLFILLVQKLKPSIWSGSFDRLLVPLVSLLMVSTVVSLVFPRRMLVEHVLYNVLTIGILVVLVADFFMAHRLWSQRITIGCFVLGILGWFYYSTLTVSYGLLAMQTGKAAAPPFVATVNLGGEALMVLASILVFWSYGSTSLFTKNKTQRKWALTLLLSGGITFFVLLYTD